MSEDASVQILTDPVAQTTCVKCRCTMETAGLSAFSPIVCPQCGHEMQVPARLGQFLLRQLIGTGGMGGVFWAHDRILNRDVAVKIMLKSLGDDRKFVETFLREAQAAARINHPNIAQIYSFGQEKGQPYIVMELVPGGGLEKLMAVTPQLDQALVMRVGAEVAAALKRASEEGLVHGDVKPENILIGEGGQAKLVDFGIASMAGGRSTEIWGTPFYIAPEKVRRKKIDYRADMYSLGGTLYHALAGVPPFDGPDAVSVVKARFIGDPKPLDEIRSDIDPEVTAIIGRMLQREPGQRYPTYDSLLGDMRRYVGRAGPGQILLSKKIVLKRKGGASTATTGHLTGRLTGTMTGNLTGSQVAGSAGSLTARVPASAPPADKAGVLPPSAGRPKGIVLQKGSIREAAPAVASQEDAARADQRSRKLMIVVLITVGLLVLAAVGVVGGLMMAKSFQKKKTQSLQARTETARSEAMRSIRAAVTQAQAQPAALADRINQATAMLEEMSAIATNVLGESALNLLVPPRLGAPAPAADTNAPSAAPATGGDVPATDLPPLVASVRAMHLQRYTLQDTAAAIDAQVGAIVDAARAADNPTNSVAVLQTMAADLQQRVLAVENDPAVAESAQILEKMAAARGDIRRLGETVIAEQKRREEERKRLEAERLAKETAERAERERKAAIAVELARVAACEAENAALLHKFDFLAARRALGAIADDLKSDDARKALEIAREKIDRLAELNAFLAAKVVGYRHPVEGWTVQSADARGLTVGGKNVPWAEVGDVRLVLFIKTFLADERQGNELKLRERVRQSVNGALYCVTFLKENALVQDLAGKLVARAIELLPAAKEDVQRILPEMIKD